jgi:hypothetical protein
VPLAGEEEECRWAGGHLAHRSAHSTTTPHCPVQEVRLQVVGGIAEELHPGQAVEAGPMVPLGAC